MENKDIIRKISAGVFFILCIMLIVGFVFTIGSDKGMGEAKFEVKVVYNRVGGLNLGAPVTLSGVRVGTVGAIDLLEEEVAGRGVQVTLNVYEKYKSQIHKGKKFIIQTEGVLGEKLVEITTEPTFQRNDLTKPIVGQDPLDVESLAETYGEAAVALLETNKTMEALSKELTRISITTLRLLNRIEQQVIDGNLFKVF